MRIFLTLLELTVSPTTGWPQIKAYLLLLPRFILIMVRGLLASKPDVVPIPAAAPKSPRLVGDAREEAIRYLTALGLQWTENDLWDYMGYLVVRYSVVGGDADRLRVESGNQVILDVQMGPGGELHPESSAAARQRPWFFTSSPYGRNIIQLAYSRKVI